MSIVEIPQGQAASINSKQDAIRILQKSECVFILWGLVRLRNIQDGKTFVLDLHCELTRHGMPASADDEVSREMAELKEGRRYISLSNDLEEFEVNAASIDLAARYIISQAAFRAGAYGPEDTQGWLGRPVSIPWRIGGEVGQPPTAMGV